MLCYEWVKYHHFWGASWAQTMDHFFERKDSLSKGMQEKIWKSGLNSQIYCTMVRFKLQFLHFPAPQLTSPAHVHRLRCSVSVLLHAALKCSNKRREMGIQVKRIPVWRQLGGRGGGGGLLAWTEVEAKHFLWPRAGTALGDSVYHNT